MFSTKSRGLSGPCYVILVVLGLGCSYAIGRPQDHAKVHVRAPGGQSSPALSFSPELLLENTLESAASPASIYPHFPPSAVSRGQPPATKADDSNTHREQSNNKGNNLDNTHDISLINSNQGSPGVHSTNPSDTGAKSNGYQPGVPRYDAFHDSYITGAGSSGDRPQPQGIHIPMPDPGPRSQPPVNHARDSTGVHVGNTLPRELAGSTEIRPQSAPHRSVYPSVSNRSPEIHEDLDVDGFQGAGKVPSSSEEDLGLPPLFRAPPPPPRPFQPSANTATGPDGTPAKAIPWQQVLSSDVDVDGPVIPQTGQRTIPDEEERFPSLPSINDEDLSQDTLDLEMELDLDSDENPFRDEDDVENEVPLELALQVIQAMKAEPAWKKYIGSGWEEMEPYWEDDEWEYDEDEEDYYDEDEESDEYDDWIPAGNMSPQNSRLITLIIETIGVTEREDSRDSDSGMDIWQILNNFPFPMLLGRQNIDDDDFYSEEYDEDEYDDEYDEDEYYDDEDEYDEDEYDEDEYDDDEYDDDEYDDDEYDDDEYDDDDEDDEDDLKFAVSLEEDKMKYLKDENDNESDEELDKGDDCDDGEPCNDDVNAMRKEDFSLFSLIPPLITRK